MTDTTPMEPKQIAAELTRIFGVYNLKFEPPGTPSSRLADKAQTQDVYWASVPRMWQAQIAITLREAIGDDKCNLLNLSNSVGVSIAPNAFGDDPRSQLAKIEQRARHNGIPEMERPAEVWRPRDSRRWSGDPQNNPGIPVRGSGFNRENPGG